MEPNEGILDRIIRTVVALAIIIIYIAGWIDGLAGLLLLISGMLLSSVISGYCPLYVPLGINTKK